MVVACSFEFELDGIGWAEVRLAAGTHERLLTISYLGRGIAEITEALVGLLEDAQHGSYGQFRMRWEGEPWRYEIDLGASLADDTLGIEVWFVADANTKDVATPRASVFAVETGFRDFARQVVDEAVRLLAEVGVTGYRLVWRGEEFPLSDVVRLARFLLECPEGSPTQALFERLPFERELAVLRAWRTRQC